jgi:hypothetical protein
MGFSPIFAYFCPDLPVSGRLTPLIQPEKPFHPHSYKSKISEGAGGFNRLNESHSRAAFRPGPLPLL